MPNGNQSEDSLSASTLRTRRRMYPKKRPAEVARPKKAAKKSNKPVTNFIRPYLHQLFIYSHSLNGYEKPLKRPFDRY